jgi:hypothetical protein
VGIVYVWVASIVNMGIKVLVYVDHVAVLIRVRDGRVLR